MIFVISVLIGSCLGLIVFSFSLARTQSSSAGEILGLNRPSELVDASLFNRLIRPLIPDTNNRLFMSAGYAMSLESKLVKSGNPLKLTINDIAGLKQLFVIAAIVMSLILFLLLSSLIILIFGVMLSVAAYFVPDFMINYLASERNTQLARSLPDVVDLMRLAVDAGMSFDLALSRVSAKVDGPLGEELRKTQGDIDMGLRRKEALERLVSRNDCDELRKFVSAINVAAKLGSPLNEILRLQAEAIRTERQLKAQESGQKAPVKILLPLIFFIFPALLILVLGPAVIQFMNNF